MKLAVVGSRTFTDELLMYDVIYDFYVTTEGNLIIVSGGARGADTIAEGIAESLDIKSIVFKPDWDRYGKRAGFVRNRDIIDNADAIVVFYGPEGESKGAKHSLSLAQFYGMPNWVYFQEPT